MKSIAILLGVLPRLGEATCSCLATPSTPSQTAAAGVNDAAFIDSDSVADYGYSCKKHDEGKGACNTGSPADYCAQEWCIVEESTCSSNKLREVTFTSDTSDKFSYEACDANFAGNSWVGFCKNCEAPFTMTSFCTCGGLADCPCVKSAPKKTAMSGIADITYVGTVASYGSGCKAHDNEAGSCAGKTDTAQGQPNDWCVDEWCIVDPQNCNLKERAVSYTSDLNDYFSYETCDTGFTGNSWVGYCKNCEAPFDMHSFCTCGGHADCPCVKSAPQKTAASGKGNITYVGTVASYGSGCKAHDKGEGSCYGQTDTAQGQPNDWCLDEWCIVDRTNCNTKDRAVSYTTDGNDYFSFETCNTNFAGNSWVGSCKNCEEPFTDSFCTCGGMEGCKCIESAMQQTPSDEDPGKAYVGQVKAYGYGCMAHDLGHGSFCTDAADTADGQANDWCLDKWCIVNASTCDLKTRAVSYTLDAGDSFSYETCDDGFRGNSWVGFCRTCEVPYFDNSFCTGDCDKPTGGEGRCKSPVKIPRAMARMYKAKTCDGEAA